MFANIVNLFFISYTCLLFARIICSWIPSLHGSNFMRFVYFYTEPYLKVFRKIIPPIGGTLDLSPLLAFLALKILKSFVLSVIG